MFALVQEHHRFLARLDPLHRPAAPHQRQHGASPAEYQDAHERAHAKDIAQNFQGQPITNVQIALFGVTGGLVPCPASVTILLICLNLKQFSLGAVMVASFSFGLALSMVAVRGRFRRPGRGGRRAVSPGGRRAGAAAGRCGARGLRSQISFS